MSIDESQSRVESSTSRLRRAFFRLENVSRPDVRNTPLAMEQRHRVLSLRIRRSYIVLDTDVTASRLADASRSITDFFLKVTAAFKHTGLAIRDTAP